jgi:hypothetical protein
MDGYKTTPATRRALAGFRRTLPRAESELVICPPDCRVDHAAGKVAGRDHWRARKAPKPRR